MTRTIEALYEDGILRPLEPLAGVEDHARLTLTFELMESRPHPISEVVGILSDEDADEMRRIIDEEFGPESTLRPAGAKA